MLPLLSVLIPTRNRSHELSHLVSIISEVDSMEIEFVISDNSDTAAIGLPTRPNMRVLRPAKVLNMTENWRYLSEQALGTYMTFVGDDDAFIPSRLLELLEYLRGERYDYITSNPAGYQWPQGESNGVFFRVTPRSHARLDVNYLRKGILDLKPGAIPMPYNYAVFHSRLIRRFEVEKKFGDFFSSRIPDVNSGVKVLFLSQVNTHFDKTVFISGASSSSNGMLTRSAPNHPRAQEFNDHVVNPVFGAGDWLPATPSPFGFITYFEAINQSLLQLGIAHNASPRCLRYRIVARSSSPIAQYRILKEFEGKPYISLSLGLIVGRVLVSRGFSTCLNLGRKAVLAAQLLTGRIFLHRLSSNSIASTSELVAYLTQFEILEKRNHLSRSAVMGEGMQGPQ